MSTTDQDIRKGLVGVVVDTTAISKVDPESNSLLYRGYPVQELAEQRSFEDVAWLLWNGELPTAEEAARLRSFERSHRALEPGSARSSICCPPPRTRWTSCGRPSARWGPSTRTPARTRPARCSSAPCGCGRHCRPSSPMRSADAASRSRSPRAATSTTPENFLWMTFGEVPDRVVVDAFRVSLVLYAEHSFNASTFTARVVTSTLSDVYSAVTAAIGALKGPCTEARTRRSCTCSTRSGWVRRRGRAPGSGSRRRSGSAAR
ncbi:citrate/2-methylcitrate synthase [Rathayibacter oskolensis]|nr:citrate/2-methylcitrate synthase [Rathayibacter oskolensis]WKK71390.1 citrate/2-methylcitrate synthase [Rathayibacter oskolensis]